MNKKECLDLYAKIEPLIGFYDDYERLYSIYLKKILSLQPKSILDFGCGNGRLLERLNDHGFNAFGIDLSCEMVKIAAARGVKAFCKNIEELDEKFDLIIAAADVLNYFDNSNLEKILDTISTKLTQQGVFIADINTLYGFKNVAEGLLIRDGDGGFLAVEANFENKKLMTNFTFFEQNGKLYEKHAQSIVQYFHPLERFKKLNTLVLRKMESIFLFDENSSDKTLMIFHKKG